MMQDKINQSKHYRPTTWLETQVNVRNFLLIKVPDSKSLYKKLHKNYGAKSNRVFS